MKFETYKTSHPHSFQFWKNAIKKYPAEGRHVYLNTELPPPSKEHPQNSYKRIHC